VSDSYEPTAPISAPYEPYHTVSDSYEPSVVAPYEPQPSVVATYEAHEPEVYPPAAALVHEDLPTVEVNAYPRSVEAKITEPSSSYQFHAQDESGNAEYGYGNQNSAKHEIASADGVVQGSYSYVDDSGHHHVNYIADHAGFRLLV